MAVAINGVAAPAAASTVASVVTFASVAIGAAAATRVVVVAVSYRINADVSSVLIGAVSATRGPNIRRTAASPDVVTEIWYAVVPTGTTASIVVTLSASDGDVGIVVFEVTGAASSPSDTDTAQAASGTVALSALTIPTNGGAIIVSANAADTSGIGWTNATEYAASDRDIVELRQSGAITTTAGTPTITATGGSTGHGVIAGIAFDVPAAQTLTPSLFTDTDVFFAPIVGRGAVNLAPSLFAEADVFFDPAVTATYALTPDLFAEDDAFFTHVIEAGDEIELLPNLFVEADVFFDPAVTATYALTPDLFVEADVFFDPAVTATYALTPDLFAEDDVFFDPTVSRGAVDLAPDLFAEADVFFAPTVGRGAVDLSPDLFVEDDVFHEHVIGTILVPDLFVEDDVFYAPVVTTGVVFLSPSLYEEADVFYTPSVQLEGARGKMTSSYVS